LTSGCVEAALVRKLPQQQSPCSRSTFTLDLNWRAALCDCFLSVAQSALQNCQESHVPRHSVGCSMHSMHSMHSRRNQERLRTIRKLPNRSLQVQ
jgi:hypothetical protein